MSQKRYAPVAERFLYSIIAKMINFEKYMEYTVIFALSFKYYVVDFQFKMAGVPHVAIKEPKGEKTGILSSLLSFVMYERSVDFKRTHFNGMLFF